MSTIVLTIITAIIGAVLGTVFTKLLIPKLKEKQMGQNIREEGPEAHKAKAGTPSMGGIAIIGAVTIAMAAGCVIARSSAAGGIVPVMADAGVILAGFILFGLLGFMDDYLKVIKINNNIHISFYFQMFQNFFLIFLIRMKRMNFQNYIHQYYFLIQKIQI